MCKVQGQKATVDELLPDVLLFPAGTDLHDHPLVVNGGIVLQVCHALNPSPTNMFALSQ